MELIDYLKKREIYFEIKDDGQISVVGYLDLRGTNITELPDNLKVGGYLFLGGTGITKLPDNLKVGGSLFLDVKKVKNISYKENCGSKSRTIFAAWVNGKICIGAGCFLDYLDMFFNAVDKSYTGEAAERYKKDAQECYDRLLEARTEEAAAA